MRAALLGLQHPHSIPHLRTLQVTPEISEIVLWDEDDAVVQRVRAQHGAKVVDAAGDLAGVLGQDELAFVLVAVANDRAPHLCLQALEHGKHVLAEKPIGMTAVDVARVVEKAAARDLILGVCYQNRSHPLVVEARTIVAQGLLGDLMCVNMQLLTTQVRFRNPAHWLFQRSRAGGGMLSWLGCHYLDMMRFVSGEEIVAVSAQVATRSGESIDVEDVAALTMRFDSGAVGSLHVGYCLALSGQGYENRQGYATHASFNGTLGRIEWSGATIPPSTLVAESVHPAWASAPRREFEYTPGESPAYGGAHGVEFLRAFVLAVQRRGEPPASGRDALRVAQIVDAAYRSSQTGRIVQLSA